MLLQTLHFIFYCCLFLHLHKCKHQSTICMGKQIINYLSFLIHQCLFFSYVYVCNIIWEKNIVFIILLFFHINNNWPIIVYKCTVLNVLLVCNHMTMYSIFNFDWKIEARFRLIVLTLNILLCQCLLPHCYTY